MYGAKRYMLSTRFGNRSSPNTRTSSNDVWAMPPEWPNTGGGWATYSIQPGNLGASDNFITKNSELEQNILP
jgi:hypothetical protein